MADKVENEEEKRQRKEGDPNIEKGKGDEQEEWRSWNDDDNNKNNDKERSSHNFCPFF